MTEPFTSFLNWELSVWPHLSQATPKRTWKVLFSDPISLIQSTPAFETSSLAPKYHHALKVHHLDSLCFFFLCLGFALSFYVPLSFWYP